MIPDSIMRFTAVAFDLDGTLYPDPSLFIRLVPFLLKEHRLMMAMGKARETLRKSGAYGEDFYETQARIMGELLKEPTQKVKERIERLIYRGWEGHFKKIGLFPHVRETLGNFRDAGVKLGLLSDFPPETKLENLKILDFFETVLCSEVTGRLKPDPAPFLELALRMKTEPQRLLYVGNSVPYDVRGAGGTGMKTALIRSRWKKRLSAKVEAAADFCFYDYRQLNDYVLS